MLNQFVTPYVRVAGTNKIRDVGVEAGLIFGKGLIWWRINTFADNGKKVTLARQ